MIDNELNRDQVFKPYTCYFGGLVIGKNYNMVAGEASELVHFVAYTVVQGKIFIFYFLLIFWNCSLFEPKCQHTTVPTVRFQFTSDKTEFVW